MRRLLPVLLICLAALELSAASFPRTILVLPFENRTQRADLAWFSESFAQTVSTCLDGSSRLVLNRLERDAAYRESGLAPGAPIGRASALKLAQSLDADWVVTGAYFLEGETLKARAEVLDAARLRMAGPFEVNGSLADLAEIQTRLAWRILAANDSTFTVGSEEEFARQFPAVHLDAHENFIRGILTAEPEARVRFLLEANRRNPADRLTAFELARHYYATKDYENSSKWLAKLGAPEANRLEARFIRGVDEFFLGKDSAAEKTFAELSRDAPLPEIWNNLGFLQAHLGRWLEATGSFDHAYQADPSDPEYSFNLGVCMWNLKRYAVAIRYLREAQQSAPEDPEIHRLLREALAAAGDVEGEKKEGQWLEAREENATNGTAGILPHPRLKKQFNGRAYRTWLRLGAGGKVAQSRGTADFADPKP